ncbi:MAG TPA: DUF3626 domain-containing protein [Chloroflexia bacterium]|nr:DUF3626 domain-containing protein [Chloroflexia bacterium]
MPFSAKSSSKNDAKSASKNTPDLKSLDSDNAVTEAEALEESSHHSSLVDNLTPGKVLRLQQTIGNRAVQRMLQQRSAEATSGSIQRAVGLPTKDEAVQEGGKAGYKIIGKSAYSKILSALEDFRKLDEANQDAIADKCVQIQGYIREWLGSSNRTKNKKGDDRKRFFIGKLRTMVKIKYWEAKYKHKTVDAAKTNAAQNSGQNIMLVKQKLLKDQLSASNKSIDAMLNLLSAARLTTNLEPDKLKLLIAAPDFQNIWMHAYKDKSPGGALPSIDKLGGSNQREDAERWLGYDPFSEDQRENRPAYCGVNVFNNPKGAAPTYGRFFLIFKDAIKSRATFTARDTFAMRKDPDLQGLPSVQTIASADNMEAILAHNEGVLRVLSAMVAQRQAEEADLRRAYVIYIEAQIHGGLSMFDVEEVVVQFTYDDRNKDFNGPDYETVKTFAKKYNIPVRFGGGNGNLVTANALN